MRRPMLPRIVNIILFDMPLRIYTGILRGGMAFIMTDKYSWCHAIWTVPPITMNLSFTPAAF